MTRITRDSMLQKIRSSIERSGYHVYLVAGKQAPRFAYTIGVSPKAGAELVLAGAAAYSNDEVKKIIDTFANEHTSILADGFTVKIDKIGTFSLREIHNSWADILVLAAIDYFENPRISVLQVVPDDDHWTVDVPDLSVPYSVQLEPVWQWLTEPWQHAIPDHSTAVTDLDVLKGAKVTEATRWEDDQWELFAGAGTEVPRERIRVVPLGTLLGADPTISEVIKLVKGKGLWRDLKDLVWQDWG